MTDEDAMRPKPGGVEAAPAGNGSADGRDPGAPEAIFVEAELARQFEAAPPARLDLAKLLAEAVFLHEMVHWGDWKVDHAQQDGEPGEAFERQAYGYRVLEYPYYTFPETARRRQEEQGEREFLGLESDSLGF